MRAIAQSIGRFLLRCSGAERKDAHHERVTRLETDLADLTKGTHALRLRLSASEAMTIALAWTHPDAPQLVERLHRWMESPADAELSDYLQALKQREHDRVVSQWTGLLEGTPMWLPRTSPPRHTLQ